MAPGGNRRARDKPGAERRANGRAAERRRSVPSGAAERGAASMSGPRSVCPVPLLVLVRAVGALVSCCVPVSCFLPPAE